DGEQVVVEEGGDEGGLGASFRNRLVDVVEGARAAGGNHWHRDGAGDGARQREVIALARAVRIHAGEQDLAGAALRHLLGPGNGVASRRRAAAVDVDLPAPAIVALFRVDGDDDALAPEAVCAL